MERSNQVPLSGEAETLHSAPLGYPNHRLVQQNCILNALYTVYHYGSEEIMGMFFAVRSVKGSHP